MFVEQITTMGRLKIGSLEMAPDQRLAANGVRSAITTPVDRIANENELPSAPLDTGMLGSTRINTPTGPVAIEELVIGQSIVTSSGKLARLSHILPAQTPKTALRIRAPYFGANQDVVIAEQHHLEISSEIAEYMFGQANVLVPAWVFKDNSKVLHHELTKSDCMYQLQIDATDGIAIGDCHVAPLLTGPKAQAKRFLNDAEARAFATERRIGQYN